MKLLSHIPYPESTCDLPEQNKTLRLIPDAKLKLMPKNESFLTYYSNQDSVNQPFYNIDSVFILKKDITLIYLC